MPTLRKDCKSCDGTGVAVWDTGDSIRVGPCKECGPGFAPSRISAVMSGESMCAQILRGPIERIEELEKDLGEARLEIARMKAIAGIDAQTRGALEEQLKALLAEMGVSL